MPLPISGSRFDRIGKKLAEGVDLSGDETADLELVYGTYDKAREEVQNRLVALGHPPITSRLKTTTTLIDKLQREPLSIRGIDDLAGARIIVDGGRLKQDQAADKVQATFSDSDKPPKVHDRRIGASHGYRAVHIIVYVDKIPVEIQLRTELQHMWAEITEKLGDKWGRGLRYGQGPEQPDTEISPGLTRERLFGVVLGLADQIDKFEKLAQIASVSNHEVRGLGRVRGSTNRGKVKRLRERVSQSHRELVTVEEALKGVLQELLLACDRLEGR